MKCERTRELFSSYWENTTEPPLRVAFEQHLAQCGQCSAEYDRFHATVVMLEELPEVEVPPDFHAAVMSRIEQVRRTTPTRVRWWEIDWQRVFTIHVPARAVAFGMAVLLMMVMLIRLTPVGPTLANLIFPATPVASGGVKAPNYGPEAPPAPRPVNLNREISYTKPGAGLSFSVTPASANDKSSIYVLRLGTESKTPVPFTIIQVGVKPFGESLTEAQAYNWPITVGPSDGSQRSEAAKITWQYEGREYTEYVFVPSEYSPNASDERLSVFLKDATIYGALSKISADYGIVILASGNLEQASGAIDIQSAAPEAAIVAAISQTGLTYRLIGPSTYVVE